MDGVTTSRVAKILSCGNSKTKTDFYGIIEIQCEQDKEMLSFESLQDGIRQNSVALMV